MNAGDRYEMPEMAPEIPGDIIIAVCGVCGFGLYAHEIAGEVMNGTFIDYQRKATPAQIGFPLCRDCREQILTVLLDPDAVEKAAIQRAQIEMFDEEDRKERDRK